MTTLVFLALVLTFVSRTTTSQTTTESSTMSSQINTESSTTSSPIATGMLSIIVQGPLEVDSTLILSCIIPNFTGAAAWSKENIAETTCFNDFCIPSRHQNYTFSRNTSDIFVTIDPLSISENGTTWTCYHGEDSTSYTVFVQRYPDIGTKSRSIHVVPVVEQHDNVTGITLTRIQNKESTIAPTTEPSITTNQPPTGKISINAIGSLEVDSVLNLACIIPTFTESAYWKRGNTIVASCIPESKCSIESSQKYTFAGNSSGIFVKIFPLSVSDNGTKWICINETYFGEEIMRTSYTVFVQPSIPTNQPPTGSCQEPYQNIGKGCYSIHDDNISGDEAFASCTDPGAYLANFETLEEAMFMKVFLQKNKTGISYFVGGRNVNRYLSSGDWRWIKHGNATKMTYFAFAPGQPSWSAEKGEDCMFFYANDRYNFYNVMCDNGHFLGGFICEI